MYEYNTRGKRQELSINQEDILTQLEENIINNIKLSIKNLRDAIINLKCIIIKRLQYENQRLQVNCSKLEERVVATETEVNK